jgi:hypothetical protein
MTMKTKNYFFYLVLILVLYENTLAQSGTPALEYSYDLAGNRTMRQVILLHDKRMQTNHDSTTNNISDTAGIAANVNNAIHNTQNPDGNANNSEATAGTTQYTENIGEQQIIIYPNPTTGSLQLKITPFNSSTQGEINVFDLQSHLLLREACTKELTLVDLSRYARGSYILKVRIGTLEREWKVVKE